MPDMDDLKEAKQYHTDIPQKTEGFFLKGSNALDWGMKNRLSRIFNPKSGRTVMLAIDHGYFQGPTTGLERVDIDIMPIAPHADTLMLTRGAGAMIEIGGDRMVLLDIDSLALTADDFVFAEAIG